MSNDKCSFCDKEVSNLDNFIQLFRVLHEGLYKPPIIEDETYCSIDCCYDHLEIKAKRYREAILNQEKRGE